MLSEAVYALLHGQEHMHYWFDCLLPYLKHTLIDTLDLAQHCTRRAAFNTSKAAACKLSMRCCSADPIVVLQ